MAKRISTKEIAQKYGFNLSEFDNYLLSVSNLHLGFFANTLAEEEVPKAVESFKEYRLRIQKASEERAKEEEARQQREREKQQAIARMLVTSGFNFDGYTIKRYSGYISGDDVVSVNRDALFIANGQNLTDALVKIRIHALKELKEAAYDLGCNAVIGVDFDYMTFEPETISGNVHYYQPYVICVTANGNAVVIEKN